MNTTQKISAEVDAVNRIPNVNQLLEVVCRTTKMGFAAVTRVAEGRWMVCSVKDEIAFGLKPGEALQLETVLCHEVYQNHQPIYIDNFGESQQYSDHPTPKMYNIQSYISFPIFRKNGDFFGTLCAIHSEPSQVSTPEIIGSFELFTDLISFQLEAIEQNDAAKERLKEEKALSEARDQFIGVLGHDLKNPVMTTRMSADLLLKFSKEPLAHKHAALIKSTSYRMQGLIENILDFAKGRVGKGIELQKKTDNDQLEKVLRQILKEMRTISPEREVSVQLALAHPVYCDADRIGQVLSNLLSHADSQGHPEKPIEVRGWTEEEAFYLSVTGAGKKIPEEELTQLFQPFFDVPEDSTINGLGLGVVIAAEIARAHDGVLEVTSDTQRTCFTLQIPLS